MKNKLFLIPLLLLGILVNAQGRRKDQSAVHAQYGYMLAKDSIAGGFMAKAGYSKIFGDKGFLGKAEGFYQDYKVGYLDNQLLPYQKYGVNIQAGYSYEGLVPVFLNIWAGGYGAYEIVNKGMQNDPRYNAPIPAEIKGFTYGVTGSAEIELIVVRKLSIVADYTQYYDLKSKFSKSNYAFFGGIKYYIN